MWSTVMSPSADNSVTVALTYYCANGTYKYPFDEKIQPYLGGGLVGALGSIEFKAYTGGKNPQPIGEVTMSGQAIGYNILGGSEFPLESYGLPITLFGGINYLGINDLTFTHEDKDINSRTFPLPINGISFHIGAKFEF